MWKCTCITPNRISLDRLLKKIDSKDVSKDGENRCRPRSARTAANIVLVMTALRSRCGHYIFVLWFISSFYLGLSSLWPPYEIGQAIIFSSCGFFLLRFYLSFFLAYCQRPYIGCLPYFHTWCGLSANLECRSEMCCTRLAENTDAKKIAISAPSHKFVGLYLRK